MRITMLQTRMGESGTLLNVGSTYTVSNGFGAAMVGSGYATDPDNTLDTQLPPIIALVADRVLTAADDGKRFAAQSALTVTIPAGLVPQPEVVIQCPPTGNLSIAVSGGATINGATTTLTRARSANFAGVAIVRNIDAANSYGVSGS